MTHRFAKNVISLAEAEIKRLKHSVPTKAMNKTNSKLKLNSLVRGMAEAKLKDPQKYVNGVWVSYVNLLPVIEVT